jgi:cholesterol oxidase
VRPLGARDGGDGYAVVTRRPGAWIRSDEQVLRARGVVVAAGAVGTNRLLATCRFSGSLPALSDQLGRELRSNAESICALTSRDRGADLSDGVSITGSAWATETTHLENVSFGGALDSMNLYFLPLTGDGGRVTRPLKLLAGIARHPIDAARVSDPRGWSRRSFMVGAMQSTEGVMALEARRRRIGRGVRLRSLPDPVNPNPTFIPELHDAVTVMAREFDLIPQTWATEALLGVPFTAHFLGGAVIGSTPETGVIDGRHRVHRYRSLLVCDGSTVPGNPGVNPSLTIAAMTERAMAQIPMRGSAQTPLPIGALV